MHTWVDPFDFDLAHQTKRARHYSPSRSRSPNSGSPSRSFSPRSQYQKRHRHRQPSPPIIQKRSDRFKDGLSKSSWLWNHPQADSFWWPSSDAETAYGSEPFFVSQTSPSACSHIDLDVQTDSDLDLEPPQKKRAQVDPEETFSIADIDAAMSSLQSMQLDSDKSSSSSTCSSPNACEESSNSTSSSDLPVSMSGLNISSTSKTQLPPMLEWRPLQDPRALLPLQDPRTVLVRQPWIEPVEGEVLDEPLRPRSAPLLLTDSDCKEKRSGPQVLFESNKCRIELVEKDDCTESTQDEAPVIDMEE
eukprot:g73861.t1